MSNAGNGQVELSYTGDQRYVLQLATGSPVARPTFVPSTPKPSVFPTPSAKGTPSPSYSLAPTSSAQIKTELSTWYIDWTAWFNAPNFVIPTNLNMINVFVGKFTTDANGNPTLGGFGNMDLNTLDAFVAYCKEQTPPVDVKVSIGGGGGSYDNTWDVLTNANIDQYAQAIVNFCHDHHLAGVDLDYEEFKSQEQEVLVGKLIKAIKSIDESVAVTMCANAGYGPSYPWETVVQTILDAAVVEKGKCPVDYLYTMTYYNPIDQEMQWALGWRDMLQTRYNCPSQALGVGVDFFDAHAYDPTVFAKWAFDNQMSVAIWATNPADKANVDEVSSILKSLT
jgi:hypothetical protein